MERARSLTVDDLEELKGCVDLGFGFSYHEIPELCGMLPALELCYSLFTHHAIRYTVPLRFGSKEKKTLRPIRYSFACRPTLRRGIRQSADPPPALFRRDGRGQRRRSGRHGEGGAHLSGRRDEGAPRRSGRRGDGAPRRSGRCGEGRARRPGQRAECGPRRSGRHAEGRARQSGRRAEGGPADLATTPRAAAAGLGSASRAAPAGLGGTPRGGPAILGNAIGVTREAPASLGGAARGGLAQAGACGLSIASGMEQDPSRGDFGGQDDGDQGLDVGGRGRDRVGNFRGDGQGRGRVGQGGGCGHGCGAGHGSEKASKRNAPDTVMVSSFAFSMYGPRKDFCSGRHENILFANCNQPAFLFRIRTNFRFIQ
uniref:Uncharacterized protein n=1 Tax=Setaria viridis TaxID=4556 RepID=A0A4U6UZ14_SETVI|nr:hypothetical protein SEVIR_4G118100v2 [Setaria viridis]